MGRKVGLSENRVLWIGLYKVPPRNREVGGHITPISLWFLLVIFIELVFMW